MNKISLLFIVLFIQFGFAQKSSYSPYSYFGVGETNFSATAENKMMGGNTALLIAFFITFYSAWIGLLLGLVLCLLVDGYEKDSQAA